MFYFLLSFSGNLKLACHGVLHPGGRLSSGAYDSETDFAFTQRCTISAQNTVVLEETCHSLPHLSASKIPGISPRELPMAPCFPHGSCLLAIDLSPANHTPTWPRSCSGSLRCSRSVTAWFSLHLTSLRSPLLYGWPSCTDIKTRNSRACGSLPLPWSRPVPATEHARVFSGTVHADVESSRRFRRRYCTHCSSFSSCRSPPDRVVMLG